MAEPAASGVMLPDVKATHLGIVAGLAMGPAVALGLGRFAYALLLPAMRADLGWNYAQAGAINTANAAGYLAGALMAAPIAARLGEKRSFVLGLVITAAALTATGATADFLAISVLRAVAGAAGALSFVTGGALASAAGGGGKGRPALALGVYFGGAGYGMVVSAFAVPALIASSGWQVGWLALGMLSLLGVVATLPAVARTQTVTAHTTHRYRPALGPRAARGLVPVLISYVMFGAGYIAYTTFIVAYLRRSLDYAATDITLFWGLVGGVATGAGIAWGPALSCLRGGRGECDCGDGCDPAGRVADAPRGRCLRIAVRRLVPDRADIGNHLRAQGDAAARLDRLDRGPHRRLCHGAVRRPPAQRRGIRRFPRPRRRLTVVGRHPDSGGDRRAVPARAGMTDLPRGRFVVSSAPCLA